tara:strand:- start:701 stop:835 length:135 start_codon:yes stop_codon:yes gene_type:complete
MATNQNGKGDKARPADKDKYDDGYDSIEWSKPKKKGKRDDKDAT